MSDPKYMLKIRDMCRCQDCGRMAKTTDIDVELDNDLIVFEWCDDADDDWDSPPCYGKHLLQTDMTAYELLIRLGIIDNPYGRTVRK